MLRRGKNGFRLQVEITFFAVSEQLRTSGAGPRKPAHMTETRF